MEQTKEKPLKLNYKRTFIIGLCFFTILLLWQVYNSQCPIMLNYLLRDYLPGKSESDYDYIVGIIMALDNLVAIFMIPLTGRLSDKTKTKLGKRIPYIIVGTILSVIAFPFIAISFVLNSLVGVVISMAFVLIFMYLYRGPAVSLMPDITPKPLRSTGNGIINFVGYIGAICGGALYFVKAFKIPDYDNGDYKNTMVNWQIILPFILVSILMIIALIILVLTIKENKILEEMQPEMKRGEELAATAEKIEEDAPMTKKNKKDLILILLSVFLWFMAFNSVETFWSIYCTQTIGVADSQYSLPTTILVIASLITFIPGSILSNKIGRKYTIAIGILCCLICMITMCFINQPGDYLTWKKYAVYVLFVIAGIGWALINVASYPMVVELSPNSKIGKFTGYYYTASMLAQTITPVAIGAIMSFTDFGRKALFPYSTILFALALIVFMFITNVKPKEENNKKGFEALDND